MTISSNHNPHSLWIFGYASLVWRPAFAHRRIAWARIDGWVRRFWQGSTDHRGVPGAPGRVATLVQEDHASCWGRVYEVPAEHHPTVLARLDHREKGGYDRFVVQAHVVGLEIPSVDAVMYVANEDNPEFLGPAPMADMVDQIVNAVGPSGPNVEYLVRLDEALHHAGIVDAHVSELATAVRRRTGSEDRS